MRPRPLRAQRWPDSGPGSVARSHDDGCECEECIAHRSQVQPRTLKGTREPRPSRVDEALLAADARDRDAQRRAEQRAELDATLATMERDLEHVDALIAQAAPGDHRSSLRAVRNGLRRLRQAAG